MVNIRIKKLKRHAATGFPLPLFPNSDSRTGVLAWQASYENEAHLYG